MFYILCGFPNSLGKTIIRIYATSLNEAFEACRDKGYVPYRKATQQELDDYIA